MKKRLINASALVQEQDKLDNVSNNGSFSCLVAVNGSVGFSDNVMDIVAQIKGNDSCHFYTDGAWNMHQLLVGLLEITGAAHIYLSSFAMSETAVRTIHSLQDIGVIKSLHCVIDNRVETRSAGSLQLLKSISSSISLRPCHAKTTVIEGELCSLVIIGSANYTENKRMEVGFVDSNPETCAFHKSWIKKILKDD